MDKYIPGWASLNWKGKAAKIQQYYDQGRSELSPLDKLWALGALLWLKEFPLVMILVITPLVALAAVLVYCAFGVFWVRRGWYKEKQEVNVLDGWSSMTNLQWRLLVALAQDRGISVKEQDVRTAPQEVRDAAFSHQAGPDHAR